MKPQNEENWYRLYLLAYNGQKVSLNRLEEGEILAVTFGKEDWDAGRDPAPHERLQIRILQLLK